ncbi:MAG: YibE/F family protein [Candidatus Uhrbacteria bacterium]
MKRLILALAIVGVFTAPFSVRAGDAQNDNVPFRAVVQSVDKAYSDENGRPQTSFTAEGYDGKTYRIDTSSSLGAGIHYPLNVGDRVVLERLDNPDGTQTVYFNDVVRTGGLWIIFAVFSLAVVAVGLTRGIMALVGLALTVLLLFGYIVPSILAGKDAVLVTVESSLLILAVNMHLTHGWKRQTLAAFASTAIGVLIAWLFGGWFVHLAALSGLTSEEGSLLYLQNLDATVNTSGILLAGIILGATGALDDIAIAQSEVVSELREANPSLSKKELFVRAMRVGRHHIASIANTLVLAYAGAALPMFLLFWATRSLTIADFLNTEAVAEEVVRTLAGTIALVLTVPLSTWFATSLDASKKKPYDGHHVH